MIFVAVQLVKNVTLHLILVRSRSVLLVGAQLVQNVRLHLKRARGSVILVALYGVMHARNTSSLIRAQCADSAPNRNNPGKYANEMPPVRRLEFFTMPEHRYVVMKHPPNDTSRHRCHANQRLHHQARDETLLILTPRPPCPTATYSRRLLRITAMFLSRTSFRASMSPRRRVRAVFQTPFHTLWPTSCFLK